MRFVKCFALAAGMALLVLSSNGQQPGGGGGGPKGAKGKAPPNVNSEQLLNDLKVSDTQKSKAREILRAHDEKMRKAARDARQDLLTQMKDVLSDDDYKTFKDELDRVPLLPTIPPILSVVSTDDLMDRLMAYDKNGDGKVTKDELPERMHSLIEQGDRNGDGALDREEIRRMTERGPRGPGNGGPPPRRPQ
jgi:hypothetical protein